MHKVDCRKMVILPHKIQKNYQLQVEKGGVGVEVEGGGVYCSHQTVSTFMNPFPFRKYLREREKIKQQDE